jgi:hypothetical protein
MAADFSTKHPSEGAIIFTGTVIADERVVHCEDAAVLGGAVVSGDTSWHTICDDGS